MVGEKKELMRSGERKAADVLRSCNEKRRDGELDYNWNGGGKKRKRKA